MSSLPRIEWVRFARLALCSALLGLACGPVPQEADGTPHPQGLKPQAILATDAGQWSPTGFSAAARSAHTATLLPSGKVLIAGGAGVGGYLTGTEVYDPATGTWSPTGPLTTAREYPTATLLPSGKVLIAGGFRPGGSPALASAEVYDPATGTWSPTGPLATAREYSTATLLPSGKVLVVGGGGPGRYLDSAEVYDPATGTWSPTGPLAAGRYAHTATLLPSGKVLIAGGQGASGLLASAEVYDPATGAWSSTGALATARSWHTATLLPSGKVLAAGGARFSSYLASAEVYDPATGTWSSTGLLATARYWHTATLLPSGKVLVAGGVGAGGSPALASAEVYDPATGAWSPTGPLATAREHPTATLLPSGSVLVAGGGVPGRYLDSTEVYDPATGAWSLTGSLATARERPTATLLPSGKVLVAGGGGFGGGSGGCFFSAEVYDPATGTWSPTGPLATARKYHTATLLLSGKVLVVGGGGSCGLLTRAEVYDPATGAWSPTGPLDTAREHHTATLLPSGKVLVVGGGSANYLASAEVYDPATGTWSPTGPLAAARSRHTATLLPSGKVLVVGGARSGGYLASAEVYDPATGAWSPTGLLATARYWHTATLLPSGKVLVAGGYRSGSYLASAEVYDPATGAWNSTGPLATARRYHTATLLPSGKVLVAGGGGSGGYLASAEVYDPATGAWSPTRPLATARQDPTATLLPSGKVLVVGGADGSSSYLASAEVYDDTGALPEWRPVITPPGTQHPGELFLLTGSRFLGLSEASSGNTQSSASRVPLVSLMALEGGALTRAPELLTFSDTQVTGRTPRVPNGFYLLSVMSSALHGGQLVRVEGPPPAPPELTLPPALVNSSRPAIGGTAMPHSTITLLLDGAVAGSTRADAQGQWSLTPSTALAEGLHRATAIAADTVGNLSPASQEHRFTVDSVLPAAPVWTAPGDFVTTPQPVFAGTAEPHSTVRVGLGDNAVTLGTAEANEAGDWSLRPIVALPDGPYQARATATDRAGNRGDASAARAFTVDTARPGAPVLSAPDSLVNTPTPLILGSAEAGSTVTVTVDDSVTRTTLADSAGLWSITPNAVLSDGPHQARATATDPAGNVSALSEVRSFTVDTTAPEAPGVTAPGTFANTPTPVLRGTAEAHATVTVWLDDAEVGTPRADAQGQWLLTPRTALAEGDHQLKATATDAVGNISPTSEEHRFTVDTVPPPAPLWTAPEEYVTTHTPIVLTGTAEAHSLVKVWLGDDEALGWTVEADAAGGWSLSLTGALPDETYPARATATDRAGNRSAAFATRTFTVDTQPPAAPVLTAPGAFANTATPVIRGSAEAGSTVTVSLDGVVVRTLVTDPVGAWSLTLDTELSEGPHQARATATDKAAHDSVPSELLEFTVDTQAPAAPVITEPGATAGTLTPVIRGTAEKDCQITVWLDGAEAQAETVRADSTGAWRFTPPSALELGPHSISVYATDGAGNSSSASLHRFSLQRSHYGFGCSSGTASPAAWLLLLLAGSLVRSWLRSSHTPSERSATWVHRPASLEPVPPSLEPVPPSLEPVPVLGGRTGQHKRFEVHTKFA